MKVSVVIPTRNREEYINEAINSILSQGVDVEVIVQNSGRSLVGVIPNDERVKLYEEEPTGFPIQTKLGFQKATGDILATLSDDDYYEPGVFKQVIEALKTHEWAYGYISMFNGDIRNQYGQEWHGFEHLKRVNFIPQPSVFWTRKAYETVGQWDDTAGLASDYEFWLRLASHYEPAFLPIVIAHYRLHNGQITTQNTDQQIKDAELIKHKYANIHKTNS